MVSHLPCAWLSRAYLYHSKEGKCQRTCHLHCFPSGEIEVIALTFPMSSLKEYPLGYYYSKSCKKQTKKGRSQKLCILFIKFTQKLPAPRCPNLCHEFSKGRDRVTALHAGRGCARRRPRAQGGRPVPPLRPLRAPALWRIDVSPLLAHLRTLIALLALEAQELSPGPTLEFQHDSNSLLSPFPVLLYTLRPSSQQLSTNGI